MIRRVLLLLLVSTCFNQGIFVDLADEVNSKPINTNQEDGIPNNRTNASTMNSVNDTIDTEKNRDDITVSISTMISSSKEESIDKPSVTIQTTEPASNSSSNGTHKVKSNEDKGINNNYNTFIAKYLNSFDRHTLIMICAFIIGLVLISFVIFFFICVCNSFQSCSGKSKKNPKNDNNNKLSDLATNPAYDDVKCVPDDYEADDFSVKINLPDNEPYPSHLPLLPNKVNSQTPSKNTKNKESLLNSTSSLSCSTASVNSVIYNKTPNSIQIINNNKSPNTVTSSDFKSIKINETTPKTVKNDKNSSALNLRSSISNIVANTFSSTPSKSLKKGEEKSNDSENERSCLLDETDNTEVANDSIVRKPIFQSQAKTGQQILREKNISKHPSYSRTQSESHSDEPQKVSSSISNNRLSAASSRSSIVMPGIPLNFDQIKDDIDDLALNKEKLVSRTNLNSRSQNGSQMIETDNQSDSVNNSIADIYIKELINKHQESSRKDPRKKMTKKDTSVSSGSIVSETTRELMKKKRLSVNVDISKVNFDTNPNGGKSVTNLDKNASVSVYTIGSEKSCY